MRVQVDTLGKGGRPKNLNLPLEALNVGSPEAANTPFPSPPRIPQGHIHIHTTPIELGWQMGVHQRSGGASNSGHPQISGLGCLPQLMSPLANSGHSGAHFEPQV